VDSSAKHVAEGNGISRHRQAGQRRRHHDPRVSSGKNAGTWEVWDTLGFLQQLGVVPTS
jgi:hypothetical protein